MDRPLLPLTARVLARGAAADVLRGLAEFVEQYPAPEVVLTVDLGVAPASSAATRADRSRTKPGGRGTP